MFRGLRIPPDRLPRYLRLMERNKTDFEWAEAIGWTPGN
jgi:hypothetical protein